MSSIHLEMSVRTVLYGRPTLKTLRHALTQVAKRANADGKVTLQETEGGKIGTDPVTLTVSWREWS